MSNFRDDILAVAGDEPIEAVVIGGSGWGGDYGMEPWEHTVPYRGRVLAWDVAAPLLDREYSTGFGAPGCPAIYAWTIASVLFVTQYDGATGICKVPRNPEPCEPEMPGG